MAINRESPQGPGSSGAVAGSASNTQDAQESAAAPKFGDVLKQMQAKYGGAPEKPREIKKTLGKDDFLRIMITQMKNQDPTNPFKAEQMATEIAQFTSVEQLQNVNQSLKQMANQNRPIEQMAMTNLIGKTVTVDRERFPHLEGQSDTLNFQLPKNASSVKLAIISENGELVFEKDLGAQKTGDVQFTWDGIKATTLPAKAGTYLYRVDAKDDRGQSIQINPKVRAQVIGVSFEGNEPVFLVGSATHQDRVTLKNISMIETDLGTQPPMHGAMPASGTTNSGIASAEAAIPKNNFFSFQKGVGSSTLPAQLDAPTVPQALKDYQMKQIVQDQHPEEQGFPNGLKDPDADAQGGTPK